MPVIVGNLCEVIMKPFDNKYGYCPECGAELAPVHFIEEEYKINPYNYAPYKTGRKRWAVSHLVCTRCLKNQCVDDSFDGPWH